MSDNFKKIIENLLPFVIVGVAIALFIGLLFMFFYIAIWGLVIGGVLWLATVVKQYLFPDKPSNKKEEGRVIEHDNKK